MQLSCLEVSPKDEEAAIAWIKKELPRRSRVNLKPEGSQDGVLLARVITLDSKQDLTEGLVSAGLAKTECIQN